MGWRNAILLARPPRNLDVENDLICWHFETALGLLVNISDIKTGALIVFQHFFFHISPR
jgi:hypothetical protein